MFRHGIQVLLIAFLVTCGLRAGEDPFIGDWKLNPVRSKLVDIMKVTKVGPNKYDFDLGAGKPERIVVDGTDQPGYAGTTLSVVAQGPDWKVIRKKDGRMFISAMWTLSKDGNSLTDDFTSFDQDGSASNVKSVFKRTAGGGPGFEGTWVSTSEVVSSVFAVQIRPDEAGGLSFTDPGGTRSVKFDGKDHPNPGGSVSLARRLNESALEIIRKSEGKITQTQQFTLSPDLKTLTITTRIVGRTEPNIYVFERQ